METAWVGLLQRADEERYSDIDECPTIMCNDSLVCFNKLGSYDCIEDPCPANYSIEDGRWGTSTTS